MSVITKDRFLSPSGKDVRVVFASSVWTLIALIAAVLLSRRLAGAFGSVPVALPCVAGTAATLFSLAAHALWSAANSGASGRKLAIAAVLSVALPLLLADALWTAPSAFGGGYLGALFILAGLATLFMRDFVAIEIESLAQNSQSSSVPAETGPRPATLPREASRSLDAAPSEEIALSFEEAADEEPCDEVDPALSQSIIRRQPAEGAEMVEGTVRIHFGPGERTAVAHVSFVPPLADRPRVECQVLTDFEGRVRIGLSQAYGLRIEARRAERAGGSLDVLVGFSAEVRAAQSEAA